MKLRLFNTIVIMTCFLLGCAHDRPRQEPTRPAESAEVTKTDVESPKPLSEERRRSAEPVTFRGQAMSLTIAPDGTVSLTREDTGKVVSTTKSRGWSVYNWTEEVCEWDKQRKRRGKKLKDGSRYPLDNMAQIGPNKIKLWSSDGKYEAQVAITANDRYLKFELLHVSNNPQGGLDDDWSGNRVEFDVRTDAQNDGWQLNTIRLNPMSELNHRWNYFVENGAAFKWPYPQWAQTTDRPQPQGAVAVFGFRDDAEHDDILSDIWAAEPSLPRPNRANLKSWTRDDVDAWVAECEAYYGTSWRMLSFSPTKKTDDSRGWGFDPDSLYPAADLAAAAGLNSMYMSQHHWQDHNIGKLKPDTFPGGREQGIAWRKYCDSLGIHLHFHGFSHLIRKPDPDYGWEVVHDDLARCARGTLLHDVPAEAEGLTILVDPDWDYYLGMKEGMLPFYDINKLPEPQDYNGGLGGTFPPYYEGMGSLISLNKNLYKYTVSLTPDNKWKVVLAKGRWAVQSRTPLVDHKAGDTVEFILTNANGNYFLPDSRSDLLVQQAIGYAQLLNDMKTGDGYDGSAWTEDLGSWGLRRFSQEVYERMDHPGGGGSALGIMLFGHVEQLFMRLQKLRGGRGGNIPVFLAQPTMLAPSLDDASKGAGASAKGKGIGLRAIHSGLTLGVVQEYGLWKEAGAMLTLWSALKPHLTKEQAKMIAGAKDGFYVASETGEGWQLTKTQAMRRDGIDGKWNVQPERPSVAPRQFFKANGEALSGLNNPYATQSPVVELHVMAEMSSGHPKNVSLMPTKADDVINPADAEQALVFADGVLSVSVDNTQSAEPYEYYARGDTVGHWLRKTDMSKSRGVAITVKGDGSGSTLVFSTGGFPRMYAVDIDFTGERTIEVPNGEAVNNREGWDIYGSGTITQFDYARVDRFRLFLHKVPAGKRATIAVTRIEAMNESRNTGLVDPVLSFNDVKASVTGTVPYDNYLVYADGNLAKVYDANWNFVKDLSVTVEDALKALSGQNTFSVSAPQSPDTWLSSRIKVRDVVNRITIQKKAP